MSIDITSNHKSLELKQILNTVNDKMSGIRAQNRKENRNIGKRLNSINHTQGDITSKYLDKLTYIKITQNRQNQSKSRERESSKESTKDNNIKIIGLSKGKRSISIS